MEKIYELIKKQLEETEDTLNIKKNELELEIKNEINGRSNDEEIR